MHCKNENVLSRARMGVLSSILLGFVSSFVWLVFCMFLFFVRLFVCLFVCVCVFVCLSGFLSFFFVCFFFGGGVVLGLFFFWFPCDSYTMEALWTTRRN